MNSPRVVLDDPGARRRRRWLTGIFSAIVLAGLFGTYLLGRMHAAGGLENSFIAGEQRLQSDYKRMQTENRRLRVENRKLSERVVSLELAANIDKEAAGELKRSMTELQSRVTNLRKELTFYRGIVSPTGIDGEARIQQFAIKQRGKSREYEYDLVLIRSAGHKTKVTGHVALRLDGLRNGEVISLAASQISLKPASKIKYGFRYFQEMAGSFTLPANFRPTLLEIEVIPEGGRADAFKSSYDWAELTNRNF